jgi:DNA-binding CsgD family transcriptional regulator
MTKHPLRSGGGCRPSIRPTSRTTRPARLSLAPTTLTSTERRVADLVCEGHSRSSMAEALFVSVNTVGTHLRSIYAKLQVHSRVQLLLALQDAENPSIHGE